MSLSSNRDFITTVTRQVHFPFDRKIIALELDDHLKQLEAFYFEETHDSDLAMKQALSEMGDPIENGIELNKVHKPLWGWLWLLSKYLCIGLAAVMIFQVVVKGWSAWQDSQILAAPTLSPELLYRNLNLEPSNSNIVLDETVSIKVALNHDTLIFDRFLLNEEGTLIILYQDIKPFTLFGPGSDHYPIKDLSTLITSDGKELSFEKDGVNTVGRYHVLIAKDVPTEITTFELEFSGYTNHFKIRINKEMQP